MLRRQWKPAIVVIVLTNIFIITTFISIIITFIITDMFFIINKFISSYYCYYY